MNWIPKKMKQRFDLHIWSSRLKLSGFNLLEKWKEQRLLTCRLQQSSQRATGPQKILVLCPERLKIAVCKNLW